MARIELRPDRWALVDFDPDEVRAIAEAMADAAGLPPDLDVVVELDDSSPLGRYSLDSMDPVLVSMESGAFEDPKHPRQLSAAAAAGVLGRLFLRVADRLTDGWADVPEDADLTPEQGVAWEVHAAGRLARAGQQAQGQGGRSPPLPLPPPQPSRLHRRGRRGLRPALVRRRPHLVRGPGPVRIGKGRHPGLTG